VSRVQQVTRSREALLSCRVAEDPYLSRIAHQSTSHGFLGRTTQALYVRQVAYLTALLTEEIGLSPGVTRILDWGCGKGHITYLLRKWGFDVTSCDMAGSQADSAFGQATPIVDELKIPVVPLNDSAVLPFASGSFDCVVSFGVLEHVASDARSMVEVRRVLRPGGIFFVAFLPYFLSWTQAVAKARGDGYHDRLYDRQSVQRLAWNSGFHVHVVRHAQLFPKNSMPLKLDRWLEPLDRCLCKYTPLRFFATNLEIVLVAGL
jgi:SAM-dependent methyltransferase